MLALLDSFALVPSGKIGTDMEKLMMHKNRKLVGTVALALSVLGLGTVASRTILSSGPTGVKAVTTETKQQSLANSFEAQTTLPVSPVSVVAEVVPPKALAVPTEESITSPDSKTPMEEVKQEIDQIVETLGQSNAVERLNKGLATNEERLEYGALLARVTELRQELVDRDLKALQADVAAYHQIHAARVERLLAQREKHR